MAPSPEIREFAPHEIPEAIAFIESLPHDIRVYIDEWDESDWRFVFGDVPDHALNGLSRLMPGARFRIRPAYLTFESTGSDWSETAPPRGVDVSDSPTRS